MLFVPLLLLFVPVIVVCSFVIVVCSFVVVFFLVLPRSLCLKYLKLLFNISKALSITKKLISLTTFLLFMQQKWWLAFLLAIPSALAAPPLLERAAETIMGIGNLRFLGFSDDAVVLGLTRLLIWVLLFTVFYAVIRAFSGKDQKGVLAFFSKNQAIVVAAVVATIGAIFLPQAILLATGAGWATIISLFLIGGPIVGIGYLLITNPGEGKETKATVVLKIIVCLILLWTLMAMKYHVSQLVRVAVGVGI